MRYQRPEIVRCNKAATALSLLAWSAPKEKKMQKRQTAPGPQLHLPVRAMHTVQSLQSAHKLSFMALAHEEKGGLWSHFRGGIKVTEDEAG